MTDAPNDRLPPYQLAVLDELLERQAELSATSAPGAPTVDPSDDRGLGAAWRSPRGRTLALRSVTAALAAAAVILAMVLVLPRGAVMTPKWELAGEVSPYWQEATGSLGVDSGASLTCPSLATCYVIGLPNGVEVTHNGGKTWDQMPLYNRLLPSLACVSASTCALVEAQPAARPASFPGRPMAAVTGPRSCTRCTVHRPAGLELCHRRQRVWRLQHRPDEPFVHDSKFLCHRRFEPASATSRPTGAISRLRPTECPRPLRGIRHEKQGPHLEQSELALSLSGGAGPVLRLGELHRH